MKKNVYKVLFLFLCFIGIKEVSATGLECAYSVKDSISQKYVNLVLIKDTEKNSSKTDSSYVGVTDSVLSEVPSLTNMSVLKLNSSVTKDYANKKYLFVSDYSSAFFEATHTKCPHLNIETTANGNDIKVTFSNAGTIGAVAVNEKGNGSGSTTGGVTITGPHCSDPNFIAPFRFIGRIFSVIKILIPLLIIGFGVWDFFRAVVAAKDDEIKKSMKSLIMRVISGIIIFFIPAIIHFVFRLIDEWDNYESDYSKCSLCITEPNKC